MTNRVPEVINRVLGVINKGLKTALEVASSVVEVTPKGEAIRVVYR